MPRPSAPITQIKRDGQPYVYDSLYLRPRADALSQIAASVAEALGSSTKPPEPLFNGYERVKLRWMKPDGKGGLTPR